MSKFKAGDRVQLFDEAEVVGELVERYYNCYPEDEYWVIVLDGKEGRFVVMADELVLA